MINSQDIGTQLYFITTYPLPLTGNILAIKIGHDGSGVGSAWHLAYVIVECPDTAKKYYFYADAWYVLDLSG